jgi:hypothetical protein
VIKFALFAGMLSVHVYLLACVRLTSRSDGETASAVLTCDLVADFHTLALIFLGWLETIIAVASVAAHQILAC